MTWWPGLGRFGVGSQRCGGGGAGGGLGRAALPRCSEGEGAVVVGDAEVGEAREVDGCGSGGEPEVVGGDAAVGDASGFVAGEPRDGAFGEVFLTLRDRLRVFSSRIGGCAVVVVWSC